MRYQFYREHKYVSAALNDLERLIAKTDFRKKEEVASVRQAFQALKGMLEAHAAYENEKLHTLLKGKSHVYEHVEEDHVHQDEQLEHIQELIARIPQASTNEEKIADGYQLYLTYRKFVGDNLLHLHEEETRILPELQRLYTDEELKKVEASTYAIMSPEELKEMLQVLFPHMNPTDKEVFLEDIKEANPTAFHHTLPSLRLDTE